MSNLYVTSGDAYTGVRRLVITVVDPDGAAVDLTGTTLRFMVKRRRSDADALIDEVPTLASPQSGATEGVAYIALAEDDTDDMAGKYLWELEADDAIGKITLASGGFYVARDLIEGA